MVTLAVCKLLVCTLLSPGGAGLHTNRVSCLRVVQDLKYSEDIFTYRRPDVMDVFFNHFKEQEEFESDVLSKVVKMNPLTEEEQKSTWKQQLQSL